MAANRVIGRDNGLPWRLPADLKRFRAITMGHPILMGRRTFESIGRPLDGRTNLIVTRNPQYRVEGALVENSIERALAHCSVDQEVMVIGGASFYEQLMPHASRIYLTLIHQDFEGDTFFPEYEPDAWRETAREDYPVTDGNPLAYSFIDLERSNRGA